MQQDNDKNKSPWVITVIKLSTWVLTHSINGLITFKYSRIKQIELKT
jgi:hypothetical protein